MDKYDTIYNIETINIIKDEIYDYIDKSGYPLCEYLYYEDIERFVEWMFENCLV